MEGLRAFDAHVHLDWAEDPRATARAAAGLGLGMLCCTVGPRGYERASELLGGFPNVEVAAGLHPWYLEDERCVERAAASARACRFVGEVGLDFGPRHAQNKELQLRGFREVCRACAGQGGKVLSIHSVRAAGAALDILEETGALGSCACIFHWFSGNSEELRRAIQAGCWFSLGERMLATRRGREYARQIPLARQLLETDLPEAEGAALEAGRILCSLERAAAAIGEARGIPELRAQAFLGAWEAATCHTHAG